MDPADLAEIVVGEEDLVVMGGVDWEKIPWIWKTRMRTI